MVAHLHVKLPHAVPNSGRFSLIHLGTTAHYRVVSHRCPDVEQRELEKEFKMDTKSCLDRSISRIVTALKE